MKNGMNQGTGQNETMAEITNVKITDNSKEYLKALDSIIDRALKRIGVAAVSHAAEVTPVDTGLARNSITFALGGEEPTIKSYQSNATRKNGQPTPIKKGSYSGTAPNKEKTVFIGSNVEYFPGLEEGTSQSKEMSHMLRKAVTNYGDEYKGFLKEELQKENP